MIVSRMMKLSKKTIDNLPASSTKETEYTDSEMSGLKLVINKSGKKYFLFRYTLHGRKRCMKIGDYPVIDIVTAHQRVLDAKRLLSDDIDPQAAKDALSSTPTLKEFCEKHYIPHAKTHKRSYADDISKLEVHIYKSLGHLRLSEITHRDIEQYLSGVRKSANLAPATASRHLALLSVIFNLAIRDELLDKNPCATIKKLKENNQRERFLSPDELQRLLAVMDDVNPETCETNRTTVAAIKLLLLTGTRREEALNAKWQDIDFDNRTWLLPQTKSGKTRYVQLNAAAIDLLKSITPLADCPYIFTNPRTQTRINTPVKAFKRLLHKANIQNFRIHDLRHHFASTAVNSGASLYVVQQLLGHASSQTTQRYAHLKNETLLAASEAVAKAMNI